MLSRFNFLLVFNFNFHVNADTSMKELLVLGQPGT